MGLIKSTNVPPSITTFSMADIEKQARAILVRARQRAEALIVEAQRQADELKRQAHAEGLAAGYDDGIIKGMEEGGKIGHDAALNEHRSQLGTLVTAMTAAMTEFDIRRRDLETEGLRDVAELAIAIAERVTRRMGQLDPEVAVANVTEAMQLVVATADVRIAVHPLHVHVLQESIPRLQMRWPALKHIEMIADESLAPGGCRIFTRHGQIDADLDVQLQRIAAELVPVRPEKSAPVPSSGRSET